MIQGIVVYFVVGAILTMFVNPMLAALWPLWLLPIIWAVGLLIKLINRLFKKSD